MFSPTPATQPRPADNSLKAVLGPTNTGKTHYAVERMLAHRTGMIGLPLRLLAREVYQKIVKSVGASNVALITGEERIVPKTARYWVATVEAMPVHMPVEFLAIDEIQTATDFDRGHIFTQRILRARGSHETLLLGAATMAPIIKALLPGIEIIERPRLSKLFYAGSKKITRQPPRTALIAFSARDVYAIAELVRRERGGAAVVMGALSPRTRNAQVELYQNGDVDFLVATDAIGMGLNLDVHHVAFAADTKFDGRQSRPLIPAEMAQIAGRAGRHTSDGTFGVTGTASPLDEEMVDRLQTHTFDPVKILQWRNPHLDFATPDALMKSLEVTSNSPRLTRVPRVTDQLMLDHLQRNGTDRLATDATTVELLWQCCQIPDYRDISPAQHADIVTTIFTDLSRDQTISTDWIADQVQFCNNTSGDIDTLSNRIKQIRTWTFVANRKNWLDDPHHWREKTSHIENRLSDALHERLTQRFVDRRTSVLLRHLRDRRMVDPQINDKGEISIEGHLIGTMAGFRFNFAPSEGQADAKALRAAAAATVAPELHNRAVRMAAAPNDQIILSTDGKLRWKGEIIAELTEGDDLLSPRIILLADEALGGADLDRVKERLELWLRHAINTQLEQVRSLMAPEELDGAARGIAFQLAENLGVMPRAEIADEIKSLDQDVRGKMRRLGVKFGAYHIFVPQSLKPAPRELALILYALKNGGVQQPGVSEIPHIVLSGRTSFEIDPAINKKLYEVAGFKVAGKRAVRVDILERLADIIRPLISFDPTRTHPEGVPVPEGAAERNGFRVTVEMTSLLGCAGEDFASILASIGYRVQRKLVETIPESTEAAPTETPNEETQPDNQLPAEPIAAEELIASARLDGVETPADAPTDQSDPATLELAALDGASAENISDASDPKTPTADAETSSADAAPAETVAETEAETKADVEAEADAKQAEPQFDEIWFPPSRRTFHGQKGQDKRNSGNTRQNRPNQNRQSGGKDGDNNPNSKGGRGGKGRSGQQARNKQTGNRNFGGNNNAPKRPEKPLDPDSPFAALAVLKKK